MPLKYLLWLNHLTSEYKDTSCDSIPSHASKAQTTTLKQTENVIPGMSQEAIRNVVQSEVSNLMQKEMQKTLERPEQPTVTKTAKPGPRKPTPQNVDQFVGWPSAVAQRMAPTGPPPAYTADQVGSACRFLLNAFKANFWSCE
ncbi:unnamed protein product [Dibothriocephalus latus]|uniref:Uncharacterized protein n=1 Tax=Dibothriocephalus latus TaxID=60516 RepID=A0A3P7M6V7_DIBLA|nr:unnamed protein product [Dibothriocephalus latus]